MNIAISGASGFIGKALTARLRKEGHTVVPLVRKQSTSEPRHILWQPDKGQLEANQLEGFDAVINLSGETIAGKRWSSDVKARIRDSRIQTTGLLALTLSQLKRPPKVFVSASASGYYGDRGDELLTEEATAGTGFLSSVCIGWEAACTAAREAGIRVVNTRFGMVLSDRGGALPKMLLPFKLALGSVFGSGKQWLSWVLLDDCLSAITHCIESREVNGAVNVVSPQPMTCRDFSKTLGSVVKRPVILRVPAPMVRLAFGEMGEALLLTSARVVPQTLKETSFRFSRPELADALHSLDL